MINNTNNKKINYKKHLISLNAIDQQNQLVFIDSRVEDYQVLAAGVIPDIEVIKIDSNRDGVQQITEVLSHKSYSQVHIVSHGAPGYLHLGNTNLSLDTLDEYREDLKTWFSLTPKILLIYGCNVAAGDAGEEFITKLHKITGAEIAASTTRIGNAAKDGNWELDLSTGLDKPELAFTKEIQVKYAGIFAIASSSMTTPDNIFIGAKDVEFTVTFDNTDTIPGYGPFTLLYLDTTGADGASDAIDDGLTFKNAKYLGKNLTQKSYTFDEFGEAIVKIGKEDVVINVPSGFEPGDTVVYLELPFGSFVPNQPPADITVTVDVSDLADNNVPLNILSQAGYKFGKDPLDNPDLDPIILENIAGKPNESIAPQLVKITKNYLGPEDETATGPNYVRQYQLVVDIAEGQTMTNLDVSDLLPDTMQFVDVASIEIANSGAGGVNNGVVVSNISTPDDGGLTSIGTTNITENDVDADGNPTPGGILTRRFNSVTGGAGEEDIVITIDFYVPRLDTQGDVIINANSGNDVLGENQSQLGDNITTDDNNIWNAKDPRDGNIEIYLDAANTNNESNHTLEEQSIAIQKSVANITDSANTPGDILEYTLEFQISDYFAFEDIIVTDTFSDGQRFNTAFTPIVNITEQGGTPTGNLDFTFNNYIPSGVSNSLSGETLIIDETDIDNIQDCSGNTVLTFKVSDELIASSLDGQLIGGAVPQGGFQDIADLNNNPPLPRGATTGTITFQTIIQDEYADIFPSGDASVDQGDRLDNTAIIDGAVLNVLDPNNSNDPGNPDALTPTGLREDDDTNAEIVIDEGVLFKSIYAINGIIEPDAATDNNLNDGLDGYTSDVEVTPGDTITYRLTYQLPISDIEELQLTDYFPLPVFDIGTEFASSTFSTTFDATGATIPIAGETHYGPLDTFHQLAGAPTPNLNLNAANNSLNYFYGDFDEPNNNASVVDLLVTVTTGDAPFADDLFLTNQVRESQENTFNEVSTRDAIVQITLREPDLDITKGVVAYSSGKTNLDFAPATPNPSEITFTPGSAPTISGDGIVSSSDLETTPIDSDLIGGLQVGDIVTFAIVVENLGGGRKGAFDIQIQDNLPDGVEIPAGGLNLSVKDGTGADIPFTGLGDPDGVGHDLFGEGIELNDPGTTPSTGEDLTVETDAGALDAFSETSGRNIAIISYDLQVNTDSTYLNPATLENTAKVLSYSSLEGGESFLDDDGSPSRIKDQAIVEIEKAEGTKSIITTSEAHTPEIGDGRNNSNARQATIGEIVRYRLVARIPEGDAVNFMLKDRLPNGQTFLDDGTATVAFVSNGDGISSSNPNHSSLNLGLGTTPANTGDASAAATNFITLSNDAIGSKNRIDKDNDTYNTGTDVYFKLGDIVNSDRDVDDEYVVVEFNAVVDNNNYSPSKINNAGEFPSNSFQIFSDGNLLDTSDKVKLEIVEPSITNILKTADIEHGDAGDTVTFTITYTNEGSSTAFEVQLLDELATTDYTNIQIVDVTSDATLSTRTSNSTSTTIDETLASVAVGETITVTYTANLATTLNPGDVASNTVNVTYSSLPGSGTASNPTGSTPPDEERDGSDGINGGVNDYADKSSHNVTINSYSIGSTVFEDSNNNGLQDDGEKAISGVKVQLFDTNGSEILVGADGILNTADDGVGGVVTNNNGNYFFDGLTPGDYQLVIPASNFNASSSLETTPFSSTTTDTEDNGEDGDNNGIQVGGNGTEVTSPIITLSAGNEPTSEETFQGHTQDNSDSREDANGDMTVDFGFFGYGSITGNVAEDIDSDPQGDIAISGVVLTLRDSNGDIVDTTTTDSNGNYSFLNVTPGDYTVSQTQPESFVDISENEGGNDGDTGNSTLDNTIAVTVVSQEVDKGNDFIEGRLSLGSTVFVDIDNNGLLNGNESGIENVIVQLFDTNGNEIQVGADGILSTSDDGIGGVTTDSNGNYFFDGLAPGEYQVVLPASNFDVGASLENTPFSSTNTDTADNGEDNDDNGIQSGGSGTEVTSPNITLAIGAETTTESGLGSTLDDLRNANGDMTVDFGFFTLASITGNVGEDTTGDSAGDLALEEVTLTLLDSNGTSVATTTTDSNGDYSFNNVVPGDYTIVKTQPEAYFQISENEGGADGDPGNNTTDNTIAVTLTSGETDTGNDFVEGKLSLGSTVFEDSNHNGLLDDDEVGIENVNVQLFDTSGNEILVGADGILGTSDDGIVGVTTDSNGNYFFDGLAPGDYQVVIPQSNFVSGGALENITLSSENTDTTDNSEVGDDNGIQVGGSGTEVTSPKITLAIGTETLNELGVGGDQDNARDANGDMTVDFGFFNLSNIDYGDAPDSLFRTLSGSRNLATNGNEFSDYQTRVEDGGAAHIIDNNLKLGNNVDADNGNFNNSLGNADDFNGTSNDEDGVSLNANIENYNFSTYSVIVDVTNNNPTEDATLIGWIDLDQDGAFEASEAVSKVIPASSGQQTTTLEWSGISGIASGTTYARFRLSTDPAFDTIDNTTSIGLVRDGEVEDYMICIAD